MDEPRKNGQFYGQVLMERRVGDLVLVDSRHPALSCLPRHAHEGAYFCLNHGGTYTEKYGRRRRRSEPGLLVFHPPGETHSEVHHTAVSSLNVEVGPKWLTRMAELAAPLDRPAEFRGDAIVGLALRLLAELHLAALDRDSDLAIESLTWEILSASIDRPTGDLARQPRWLRDAHELLHTRVGDSLTLGRVARLVGVHPVHFAATFRRFYGCSVGEYVRRRRLTIVRQRLAIPDLSLAQIATDAGFADQSHLTRTFRRFVGVSPERYRTFLRFKTR
jgi:AraC family transcriptional regulator